MNTHFKLSYTFLLLLVFSCTNKNTITPPEQANYAVIPTIQEIEKLPGYFSLNSNTKFSTNGVFQKELSLLLQPASVSGIENEINFVLEDPSNFELEGYQLSITEEKINLIAQDSVGIARGIQTLKQLAILNNNFIPCGNITDFPQFEHRGLLLDCARHFYAVETILKYIDLLALYKMNVLHWHLTEDQGWRIAIDKYPQLTAVGAYRTEADGSVYGGFYTKDDIKRVVQYAKSKHIEVIPEIELPGHSQAAIAAYPHLSCTGDSVPVVNDWGVFKEIYCAGNDSVFTFLEDVLSEVVDLFPSKYIHIGGDEAPKTRWKSCSKCQKRMKQEKLANEEELQRYFIERIQGFLKTKNKEIIGWDEILEGGLAEGAIVQSWRGFEGGIHAAQEGNKAIMSPTSHAYFDYDLKAIDLAKVYSFDPIPPGLTEDQQELIIGGECNMWTEHVPDSIVLDQKVFPRLLAMSEVLWSYPTERDFTEFSERVSSHYLILDKYKVNYGEEAIPFTFQVNSNSNSTALTLSPYSKDIQLSYAVQKKGINEEFKTYQNTLKITEPSTIVVQPEKNGKKYGDEKTIQLYPNKATGKTVQYKKLFSEFYTAGGKSGLVDAQLGSLDFRDGAWQGFSGENIDIRIDLGDVTQDVQKIKANFHQYNNSWIFIPESISVEVSLDGKNWITLGDAKPTLLPTERGKHIETLTILNQHKKRFRYVRFKATNIGIVPDWHEASGSKAWIFIDEIIVE